MAQIPEWKARAQATLGYVRGAAVDGFTPKEKEGVRSRVSKHLEGLESGTERSNFRAFVAKRLAGDSDGRDALRNLDRYDIIEEHNQYDDIYDVNNGKSFTPTEARAQAFLAFAQGAAIEGQSWENGLTNREAKEMTAEFAKHHNALGHSGKVNYEQFIFAKNGDINSSRLAGNPAVQNALLDMMDHSDFVSVEAKALYFTRFMDRIDDYGINWTEESRMGDLYQDITRGMSRSDEGDFQRAVFGYEGLSRESRSTLHSYLNGYNAIDLIDDLGSIFSLFD